MSDWKARLSELRENASPESNRLFDLVLQHARLASERTTDRQLFAQVRDLAKDAVLGEGDSA